MVVVGLTGGIGSGKTTVAQLFASYDTPIIDADLIAHEITQPGTQPFTAIINHFGSSFLLSNGQLDRRALRTLIFKNPQQKQWLENLLHPLIKKTIQQKISQISTRYCIVAIPLLFETGPYEFIDRILVVDTPPSMQRHRAADRDQVDQDAIDDILNTQVDRNQRLAGADDIITNDKTLTHLASQVERLHLFYSS